MKKILLAICIVFTLNVSSQTIDTTVSWCTAAKVKPFIVQKNYPLKDTITHLGYRNVNVYQADSAVVSYSLIAISTKRNVIEDYYTLTNEEYIGWDKTAETILAILGRHLNITFK